jgi:hypothetical protein
MCRRNIVLQIVNFFAEAEILLLSGAARMRAIRQLEEWFHAVSEFSQA